jgi:hypothetical protein
MEHEYRLRASFNANGTIIESSRLSGFALRISVESGKEVTAATLVFYFSL